MANSSGLAKQRRALTKFWLAARLPIILGVAAVGLVIAASIGYGKMKAGQLETEKKELEVMTKGIAAAVGSAISEVGRKARDAVDEDDVVKLLSSADSAQLSAYEQKLAGALNGVISVKVLPPRLRPN